MAFTTCQRISSLLLLAILASCPDSEILCHHIQYKSFFPKQNTRLNAKLRRFTGFSTTRNIVSSGIHALLANNHYFLRKEKRLQGDSRMKFPKRIIYVVLLIPFALAFLSWLYFPAIAQWIIANLFGYKAVEQAANPIWNWIIRFFYSWYTFVAIGIAGAWVVAAVFARRQRVKPKRAFYPMVSFVVPAYNQGNNIARCITSLFRCAEKYDGNCEVIVVDDGSNDYTYEVAWSTVQLCRRVNPRVRGKVVRHSTNLGKIEALRSGLNPALGGLVAIVDGDSEWSPETLVELVDYKLSDGKRAITGYVHPNGEGSEGNLIVRLQRLEYSQGLGVGRCAQSLGDNVLVVSGAIGLYDADLLREVLMEGNIRSVTEDLEITLG